MHGLQVTPAGASTAFKQHASLLALHCMHDPQGALGTVGGALKLQEDNHAAGFSDNYMGVCQLQDRPGRLHRRLDIKVAAARLWTRDVAATALPCGGSALGNCAEWGTSGDIPRQLCRPP